MAEDQSDQNSSFENFISRLETFGLGAARLILSIAVSGAVVLVVGCILGLVAEGVRFERATNDTKYRIDAIAFVPRFSNILLSGRSQSDADNPVSVSRVLAAAQTRSKIIAERQAYMSEVGICLVQDGKCADVGVQKQLLSDQWGSANIHTKLPNRSAVSFANGLSIADVSPFYGAFGFTDMEASLKSEWIAVNNCFGAYKGKNGNLYIQKAPELFDAVLAQCDRDYQAAVSAELNSRPSNWTFVQTAEVYALGLTTGGLFATIIMIALTIIFFRLEVSFRSLRNLSRLS